MNLSDNHDAGLEPIGGNPPKNSSRTFPILAKDFSSVEQSVPIRLIWGRAKVAGVAITPIFGFRTEQVTTQAGK